MMLSSTCSKVAQKANQLVFANQQADGLPYSEMFSFLLECKCFRTAVSVERYLRAGLAIRRGPAFFARTWLYRRLGSYWVQRSRDFATTGLVTVPSMMTPPCWWSWGKASSQPSLMPLWLIHSFSAMVVMGSMS